jgi:bifunctional enzyme CysN/CysC
MPWHHGGTLVDTMDRFPAEMPAARLPLRMPVQEVYRFTDLGDQRRIIAGTIESGTLSVGDELVFFPSGKTSRVATIEGFPNPPCEPAHAGQAVGFTLAEQIYVRRGELAAQSSEPPPNASARFRASVFWLGHAPLEKDKDYILKLGAARVRARVEDIRRIIDTATLQTIEGHDRVARHEVAECTFSLRAAIAFDRAEDNVLTGRFVIVDGYDIRGGGLVLEALTDPRSGQREKVVLRNLKWQKGHVSREQREARFGQKAALVLVSGKDDVLRKTAARALEAKLYQENRLVYFLGIGSLLYGVDADIRGTAENHEEDIRRFAEVAHILLDSGMILVVTASELCQTEWEMIRMAVDPERAVSVWVCQDASSVSSTDLQPDMVVVAEDATLAVQEIIPLLHAKGILPG